MRLFKFIGLNSAYGLSNSIELIKENKIWISSFKNLNDPFEFRFNHQNAKPDLFTALKNSKKGVLSLSSVKDDLLLWSHYGTSHRGLCFEFETENDGRLQSASKMEYESKMPVYDQQNPDRALFTKAMSWKYESEYRVLVPDICDVKISLDSKSLQAVYFGVNIAFEDVQKIYPLCMARHLPCYQAETVNEDYTIQFKQIKNINEFSSLARKAALKRIVEEVVQKSKALKISDWIQKR